MQISRTLAACLIAGFTTLLLCGCATDKSASPQRVRQRFVPSTTNSASASWTALAPFPHAFGDPQVIAHAGVGDKFPVQEPGGPLLFEVAVLAGDDDQLGLEIRTAGVVEKKFVLRRNKSVTMQLKAGRFEFSYPIVHVSTGDPPTADKAMILVRRCP